MTDAARLAELERQVRMLVGSRKQSSLFVPVTVTNLKDTAGNTWDASARNTGAYTFTAKANADLWPETAKAVILFLYAVWSSANTSYTASCRQTSGSTNVLQIRSQVASIGSGAQGIVPLDKGQFTAEIAGANTTQAVLRIVGYIL